jgi:hypothetical protein
VRIQVALNCEVRSGVQDNIQTCPYIRAVVQMCN